MKQDSHEAVSPTVLLDLQPWARPSQVKTDEQFSGLPKAKHY